MEGNYSAVPSLDKFPAIEDNEIPGAIIFGDGNVIINSGRKAVTLKVINTGDRPIQVLLLCAITVVSSQDAQPLCDNKLSNCVDVFSLLCLSMIHRCFR